MFIAFVGLVTAGIMKGVKDYREFKKPEATTATIAAATILENATLSDWTRSNKEVADAVKELIEVVGKHCDELHAHQRETVDLRYAIDRLTGVMSRGT